MIVTNEELEKKAKELNDKYFGRTRKKKVQIEPTIKAQINDCIKFALEKALKTSGLQESSKKAFVELLKEQKDAINLLLVPEEQEQKSIELLKPLFEDNTKEFLHNFREVFSRIQNELNEEKKNFAAA